MKLNIVLDTDEETTEEALIYLHAKDYRSVVLGIKQEILRLKQQKKTLAAGGWDMLVELEKELDYLIKDRITEDFK